MIPDLVGQNAPVLHELGPFVDIISVCINFILLRYLFVIQELFKIQKKMFSNQNLPKVAPNAIQLAALIIVQLLAANSHDTQIVPRREYSLCLEITKFWVSG